MGWCDKTTGMAIHRLPDGNNNTVTEDSVYLYFFELPSDLEGILKIGDRCIGKLLSHSPTGNDGVWPHETVRDILERYESRGIEVG